MIGDQENGVWQAFGVPLMGFDLMWMSDVITYNHSV